VHNQYVIWKLKISTTPTGPVTPSLKGSDNIRSSSESEDNGGNLNIAASKLTEVDNKSNINNDSDKKYVKQLSKLNKKFKGNYSKYIEVNRYRSFLNRYLK